MPVFNFTINCPVTPTPTPTPQPTPCPCDSYQIENVGGAPRTVFYTDCRGISRSIPVGSGVLVEQCACSVTPETNIVISNLGACGSAPTNTPTPTPTSTPTPTPSFPPTPTSLPTYTVTVYAKLRSIPNDIRPPGSGAETAARAYYSLGNSYSTTLIGGNISSTSCNLLGTVSNVPEGTKFNIGMLSWSYGTPIHFDANSGTTSCPPGTDYPAFCGRYDGIGGGASFLVTGNLSITLTAATLSATVEQWIDNPFKKSFIVRRKILRSLYYCNGSMPAYYYFTGVSQAT